MRQNIQHTVLLVQSRFNVTEQFILGFAPLKICKWKKHKEVTKPNKYKIFQSNNWLASWLACLKGGGSGSEVELEVGSGMKGYLLSTLSLYK